MLRVQGFEAKWVILGSTAKAHLYSLGRQKDRFRQEIWNWNQKQKRIDTSGIQGTDNGRITNSNLSFPKITEHCETDIKNLHWLLIYPPRLLWIEGSPDPHKAEGHCKPSHIGPLIRLCKKKGKATCLTDTQLIPRWLGDRWKEARGFHDRHLMKQTREGVYIF